MPHFDGLVKSISPTSWVITGRDGKDVTVTVNAATKIEPGVNVGDAVHVAGTTDSSGNIVAWSIRKARTR
ncbi:MAG TPA: DUF5666 domain-containing protein [Thermoanaerobaculia bacterium]|nr:DUF5666 domain-containing protein [Thermoanaerobaculia bacterium]